MGSACPVLVGTEIEKRLSRLYFEYEITDATGTRRSSEVHELGLFTTAELLRTFQEAGLHTEYDPKGLTDRGLYVARIAASHGSHTLPAEPSDRIGVSTTSPRAARLLWNE